MRPNLHFESTERNPSEACAEAVNGRNKSTTIQAGFVGNESGMTVVAPAGSAVGNGGNGVRNTSRRDGIINTDESVELGPAESTTHFESKDDCKDGNFYENDFPGGVTEENSEHLIKDRENEILQSAEETYETGVICENRSDDVDEVQSQYNTLNGSDAGDDGNSFLEITQSTSSQEVSNQGWPFQNIENEVFFGGNDWGEYLHDHEVDMDGSTELWEAMKEQDTDQVQVDVPIPIGIEKEKSNEHAELEGGPEVGYLSGDNAQVRGTGRPDLDDGEDDFDVSEETKPLKSIFVDGRQNSGSGRLDLDEDGMFSVARSTRCNNLRETCSIMSQIREESFREDTDGFLFELHGQVDEHAQDELRSAFAERSSERLGAIVTSEKEIPQERKESDVPKSSEGSCSSTIQFVQLPEAFTAKANLGLKMQTSGDEGKGTGLDIENDLNFSLEKNVQGSGDALQCDGSHAQEEGYFQVAPVSEIIADGLRKKGKIVRLGSKEAEELLQMDIAKVGRAVYTQLEPSSKGSSLHNYERAGVDWAAEDLGPDELSRYVEALEVKETYIDTVLDMEDVLFGAEEGTGARIFQVGKSLPPGAGRPARDGSVTASTSSESASILRQPASNLTEVDWVEVVGALQRKGGASLGDRVVGVKEHTIYRIKVNGGGNEWEILRRYRDFVVLYNQLIQLFVRKGNTPLPTPWEKVKAESRKFFRNTSPDVVEVRSTLIQSCLQSLLQAGPPLSTATPLLRFLFPDGEVSCSTETGWPRSQKHSGDGRSGSHVLLADFGDSQLNSPTSDILSSKAEQDQIDGEHTSVFGKTIRLIVQIHKRKSLKQQLQAQHYTCAGCYKHLELALGLVPELVQNWGWSGPRFCDYSGQLFCSTCHLNETAIIPARVLQQWDFAPQHVSQLAKAYLDSIYDKPMLCVSAVNPYLYARVPVLAHLTEMRRNLSKMLACIRCPIRARIQAMMGSRRYLLENNDFFALRDLADLSKGAFAVLPGYMQGMLLKLSIHITRECSACQELGEACGAGELCDDPFDVLYPYQDKGITRCQLCHLPYHKRCFLQSQKCCSCRKDQSVHMRKESPYSKDVPYNELDTENGPRINLPSSVPLERDGSAASSFATPGENKVKAKKNLLANLLGSKEIQCSKSQIDSQNSVILNMNALLSPLDL